LVYFFIYKVWYHQFFCPSEVTRFEHMWKHYKNETTLVSKDCFY
jgi:hypothetical protein